MTQVPPNAANDNSRLIESLSAQPVAGCHWLQRVQFAAKVLLNANDIVLVAKCKKGEYQLAGHVTEFGEVETIPPDHLEYFDEGKPLPALNDLEHVTQTVAGNQLAAFPFKMSCAIYLPWHLGIKPNFAFLLLFSQEETLSPSMISRTDAFLTVANNLLRRATKRALIDAGAWIESEIEKLATLQGLLQPADLASMEGVTVAAYSQPHAYAGGDYYDIAQIPDNESVAGKRCLITIADVSGHGPAAVVETAMIDSILRTFSDVQSQGSRNNPADVMTYLNKHMFTRQPRPSFATMFAAQWRSSDSTLEYCLAGHPPPLLKSKSGKGCDVLPAGDGIPLQILKNYQWEVQSVRLQPGDILVAYTDGITEALSPAGVQFGLRRLRGIVANGSHSPTALLAEIKHAVSKHVEGRRFHDDQTIIVAEFD